MAGEASAKERPLVVAVSINGERSKSANPNVPIGPDQIVATALSCYDAGASIIHCHNASTALTGQAVHRDVAMTGEITLRGRVLAIGGLREKTMGALRAGVHTVILPKENEKDLDEIDPLVREKLRFVPVETVDAVFAEALVLPEKCTAAAHESYLPPVQESAHGALRAGEMS